MRPPRQVMIAQNTQLGAALDADDDVLLNRLIAAGASPNATNLDGQTLLAVAIADGRTRCRAVLEAAGANRGLPKRRKHADDSDGAGEVRSAARSLLYSGGKDTEAWEDVADADTADMVVQFALFGVMVYG